MTHARIGSLLLATALLVAGGGCLQVLGLDGYKEGGGGSASTTTTSSSSTTTSSTGTGMACMPGDMQLCYTGDPATKNVGACKEGSITCVNGQLTTCMGEITPMPEDPYASGDENCDGVPTGDLIKAKTFDGGFQAIYDMATDAQGNLVIAGFFDPSVNFGPAPGDALIAQLEQDFFVAKFDPQGNYLWSKRFGNSTNEIYIHLAVTDMGDIWLTGLYKATITFGPSTLNAANGSSGFVAHLDPMGTPLKAVNVDPGGPGFFDIAALPGGDAVLVGSFNNSIDFGGGKTLATTGSAGFIARFAKADLSTTWAKKYGDGDPAHGFVDGNQQMLAVATDSAGNIGAVGNYTGSIGTQMGGDTNADGGMDGFFVRLLPTGDEAVRAYAGGLGNATLDGIASDATGAFVITGSFDGAMTLHDSVGLPAALATTGPMDKDLLVWKLTGQGKQLWGKKFGDGTSQAGAGGVGVPFPGVVTTSPSGRILYAGGFFGSIDFGGKTITSAGDQDAFIAMLETDGKLTWAKSFGDGTPLQLVSAGTFLDEHRIAVGFVNTGTMDLGNGPLSPMMGNLGQFILASFSN